MHGAYTHSHQERGKDLSHIDWLESANSISLNTGWLEEQEHAFDWPITGKAIPPEMENQSFRNEKAMKQSLFKFD